MKKILGIVLAMAMVASVFAAEPVANLGVTEFTGSATVTFEVKLDDDIKTGFKNDATASLKFTVIDGGSKATASDADVWGEIAIKTDGFKYTKDGVLDKNGAASVDYAKLHVGPAYIGIKEGNIAVDGMKIAAATKNEATELDSVKAGDQTKGITLGLDMANVANFAVNFRSVGIDNDYGISATADVKAIDNLTLKGGVSYEFDSSKFVAAANVAYDMALTDVFYIKPQFALTYDDKVLMACGFLFGWNKIDYKDSDIKCVNSKVTNGVSVEAKIDGSDVALHAGIYDCSFVDGLTFGTEFALANNAWTLGAGAKYVVAVGDGKITPYFGMEMADGKLGNIKAGADFTGFVPFTTFAVDYDKDAKTIDLSCKIAF